MSRQARLIVILTAMSLVGVVTLGLVAERYSRVIAARQQRAVQTPEQAAAAVGRAVESFVNVRRELHAKFVSGEPGAGDDEAARTRFTRERDRACAAERLAAPDYRELRQHYRLWKRDPGSLAPPWEAGFEARREELERYDLGPAERLDR